MKSALTFTIFIAFIIQGVCQENSGFKGNHPNVHKIIAKEVLQTTSYTYVFAEENGELNWIAVPKMDAIVGETYYYQGGTQMGEFTSKELDRTFDAIIFLNGLISSEVVEGGGTALNVSTQKTNAAVISITEPIEPAQGGVTIAELYANKDKYAGNIVKIRGKVTKYNAKIMSRNWIHLQDDAANQGKMDLTATSSEEVKVGDIITLEGMITLNKDFGSGYFFDVIMEKSRIVDPLQ